MKVGDIKKKIGNVTQSGMPSGVTVKVEVDGREVPQSRVNEAVAGVKKASKAKVSKVAAAEPTVLTATDIADLAARNKYDANLKKSNLVRRLQKLSNDKKRVSFLVQTPGSTEGRLVQAVILVDFIVVKTSSDNYTVTGRDIEHEVQSDLEAGIAVERHVPTAKRAKENCVFRTYRVDRILAHTMSWA